MLIRKGELRQVPWQVGLHYLMEHRIQNDQLVWHVQERKTDGFTMAWKEHAHRAGLMFNLPDDMPIQGSGTEG